jgi:transcriptional regulator with XRE-family HTH domain
MIGQRSEPVGRRFSENLRRLRQERGLSQEALAELAGMHRTQISLIETKHRLPRSLTILALVGGLGVEIGDLFEGIAFEPIIRTGGGFVVEKANDEGGES